MKRRPHYFAMATAAIVLLLSCPKKSKDNSECRHSGFIPGGHSRNINVSLASVRQTSSNLPGWPRHTTGPAR